MDKFEKFCTIIDKLLGEEGCPWDKAQTHKSLKSSFLEECYEMVEAIDLNDMPSLKEELGDVLLHIIMQSKIADKEGHFGIDDVIQGIIDKIVYRHPHVFENAVASDSAKALENWDLLKQKEKGYKSQTEILQKIPQALPALLYADKIQSSAAKTFPVADLASLIDQAVLRLEALKKSYLENDDFGNTFECIGRLLFNIVSVSKLLEINAEFALTNSSKTFINRFENAENKLLSSCNPHENIFLL